VAKNFLSGLFGKKKPDEDAAAEHPSAPEDMPVAEAGAPEPIAPAPEIIEPALDEEAAPPTPPIEPAEKKSPGWLSRLTQGLSKSSSKLTDGVAGIFNKRKLDQETLDELEELLITADLGVAAAERITDSLAQDKFDKEITDAEVRETLAGEVAATLAPLEKPLLVDAANKPHVILMIGVNGSGKTTTIGKLAQKFKDDGLSVMLAAGDTFRAAAIEQLSVWGERTGAPVIAREVGADAAGLAFDAVKEAKAAGADVLFIDTAGRLQNKSALMDELAKIVRVLKKLDASAPHDVILVLDATVGQNAISQAAAFSDIAGVTGLVMTKLDGTARGGVLVALGDKFALPIHFIGVGESVDDLQTFHAESFARALAGAAD
jgi:fused signal recognition particle receptor